jgi:26S proteasome regulatory subunit N9
LNQVKLARLANLVGSSLNDDAKSYEFYTDILKARESLGTVAALSLDMDAAIALLHMGKIEEAKAMIDTAKELLPTITAPDSLMYSKFYLASAEYRKIVGPPQDFYNAGLMLLAYTPVEELSQEMQYKLATDMALASITGEDIFNFGEVIATPILKALDGTPNEWLRDLVVALNSGDIDNFNLIVDTNRTEYGTQPALMSRHETVKQKVVLLCLMNLAFDRPSNAREIGLSEIADATRIPLEQVEWVLMRAMSLGLIRGVIDQVASTVNISWVQPRVLDRSKLGLMVQQLGDWSGRVKGALVTIEDQTAELYVS